MEPMQSNQDEQPRPGLPLGWLAAGGIALIVLGLLAYGLFSRPAVLLEAGSAVPGFQLTALDGTTMDLAAERGNVVVINFFASWCNPCRQEAADLEAVWREYRAQDVQFFGIAYKDAESKAQAFLDEFGVTFPIAVEPGNHTARAYGVTGVPETFVVDREGRLIQHFIGPVTQTRLGETLDSLVGQ